MLSERQALLTPQRACKQQLSARCQNKQQQHYWHMKSTGSLLLLLTCQNAKLNYLMRATKARVNTTAYQIDHCNALLLTATKEGGSVMAV
jgi:uncharacterized phage-like protein YoqJ